MPRKAAQVYFKNTDMIMLRWEELGLDSLGEKTGARVGVVNLCEMYNWKNEDWTDQEKTGARVGVVNLCEMYNWKNEDWTDQERRQEREWAW